MDISLNTQRLTLRSVRLADAPAIEEAFNDWDMVKYMSAGVKWPRQSDTSLVYFRDNLIPRMEKDEAIGLSIIEKSSGAVTGLIHIFPGNLEDSWGFWIGKKWQGKGYMSEALTAVLDYMFDVLGFPLLAHHCVAENAASAYLGKKAGGVLIKEEAGDFVGGRMTGQIWHIAADAWRTSPLKASQR